MSLQELAPTQTCFDTGTPIQNYLNLMSEENDRFNLCFLVLNVTDIYGIIIIRQT